MADLARASRIYVVKVNSSVDYVSHVDVAAAESVNGNALPVVLNSVALRPRCPAQMLQFSRTLGTLARPTCRWVVADWWRRGNTVIVVANA